jgi:hypothetical protein
MFRLLCMGALIGYFFGLSKQGQHMKEQVGSFLTELLSDDTKAKLDEKKSSLSEMAKGSFSFFKHKNGDSGQQEEEGNGKRKGESSKTDAESNEQPSTPREESVNEEAHQDLDVEKAQELADKLGAKPVIPEDENLTAYHHSDDELKSA